MESDYVSGMVWTVPIEIVASSIRRKVMKRKIMRFIILNFMMLLYSMAAVFSKFAAREKFFSIAYILWWGSAIFVLFIYALGWQQIIKDVPLVVAYMYKATSVLWGLFWGMIIFGEKLSINKILGGILVIVGLLLMLREDNFEGKANFN